MNIQWERLWTRAYFWNFYCPKAKILHVSECNVKITFAYMEYNIQSVFMCLCTWNELNQVSHELLRLNKAIFINSEIVDSK